MVKGKRFAAALALGLVLLSGCGKGEVTGVWRTEVDLAEEINGALARAGLGEYLSVRAFPVAVEFSFRENGTYSCRADGDSFAESVEELKAELLEGFADYTEDLLLESGVEMEAQEVFDAMGVSLPQLLDGAFSLENLTGLSAGEEAGRYEAKGGRLYFSKAVDQAVDRESWDVYTVEEGKLIFREGVGSPHGAFSGEQYPIEFEKVGE